MTPKQEIDTAIFRVKMRLGVRQPDEFAKVVDGLEIAWTALQDGTTTKKSLITFALITGYLVGKDLVHLSRDENFFRDFVAVLDDYHDYAVEYRKREGAKP